MTPIVLKSLPYTMRLNFQRKYVKNPEESQYSIDKLLSFIHNELEACKKQNHLINSFDLRTKQSHPDLLPEMRHKSNKLWADLNHVKVDLMKMFVFFVTHLIIYQKFAINIWLRKEKKIKK